MFRSENEMTAELDNYFDQNSCQELDDLKILVRFFKDFDQNSGGQMTEILQELDDHGILTKFSSNLIRIM